MKILANTIERKNILVLGDIMLDRYYKGTVKRISPEAPVPVFLENEIEMLPGGAANVAVSISATEQNISLATVIGNDSDGKKLKEILENKGIDCSMVVIDSERPTTVKNRFLGENHQQILRHDREVIKDLSEKMQNQLRCEICSHINEYDLIVISDYGKGVCTEYLLQTVIQECHKYKKKVIADVKGNESSKYRGVYLIKPNRKELSDLTGRNVSTIDEVIFASKELCEQCQTEYVLTTCGPDGMIAVDREGIATRIESIVQDVFDVTGAGDTVLAFMAMGIVNGMKMEEMLRVSNFAAGIQVSKVGTSFISIYDVEVNMNKVLYKKNKVIDADGLVSILSEHGDKKVVFTNGCYDLIHVGHIQNLKIASELGDILVVALNSDDSVSRLKGKTRPINSLQDRMSVLASIEYVDYVTSFEEDTSYEIISKIKPDILVKGSDYKKEDIVGKDIVESYGGRIELVPYVNGKSTTNMIHQMMEKIL